MSGSVKPMSILTVEYRSLEHTKRLVESLRRQHHFQDAKITIVNNSVDSHSVAELEEIARAYEDITVHHNISNAGYFGGFNAGLPSALEGGSRWLVLCNSDMVFDDPLFLDKLHNIKVDDDVLCIAPCIWTPEGDNQNPFWVRRPKRRTWLLYRVYLSSYALFRLMTSARALINRVNLRRVRGRHGRPEKPFEIYAPHGACFVMSARYFEIYGRLDESLLIWGEEAILGESIRLAGGRVLYEPRLRVLHNQSGSIKTVLGRTSPRAFVLRKRVYGYVRERYFRYENPAEKGKVGLQKG